MLIVSKHHDYYDGVAKTGVDKTIIYHRKSAGVTKTPFFSKLKHVRLPNDDYKVFLIGFCGQTYCCISRRYFYDWKNSCPVEETFFHSSDYFDKLGEKYKSHFGVSISEFFAEFHNKQNLAPFLELDAPVFIHQIGGSIVTINPNLKQYQFQKVVDPYQAFQRLSQFLSNELAKENPIPQPADKYKILAQGMDKWSFRNPDPPKRKQA